MRTDTTNSKTVCNPSSINDCPHYQFVDPNAPDVKKSENYIYVGVQMPPQYVFHVQRIADEHFPKENTKKAHPGNKAGALEELVKYSIDRYNEVKKRGTFREIMEGVYDDSSGDNESLRERIEELQRRNQRLKKSLKEKNQEVKELKKDYNIVRDNSDVLIHIMDLLQEQSLSLDELVDKLRDEKGLEFRKYQHPLDPERYIGLKGLTDYFLQNLIDRQSVEVNRNNGRTVYAAKGKL